VATAARTLDAPHTEAPHSGGPKPRAQHPPLVSSLLWLALVLPLTMCMRCRQNVRPPPPAPPEGFPGHALDVQVWERGAWRRATRDPQRDCDGFFYIICSDRHKDPRLERTLLLPHTWCTQPALPPPHPSFSSGHRVCALCSIRGNICRQHLLTCAVEAMGIPGWDRSTWYKVERVGLVYREREKKCGRGVEAA